MNKKLTISIALTTFLTVSGCVSHSQPSAEMEKITNQQVEIETLKKQHAELQAQLTTLQEMQPSLKRLVSIENELNILIKQLRELAQENKRKAHKKKKKQYEARSFYMLQLAALDNLDRLKKNWVSQQQRHPSTLKDLPARYQQVEVNGKQYYRLKVGEFKHKEKALKACKALTAQQVNCIVVNNIGKKL